MRVVVQRVTSARVEVAGEVVGAIGQGLLILAGFEDSDSDSDLGWMSSKVARLRIFPLASPRGFEPRYLP
jgi:D-tyrosyl-tRNA(Tyr) deacylase